MKKLQKDGGYKGGYIYEKRKRVEVVRDKVEIVQWRQKEELYRVR